MQNTTEITILGAGISGLLAAKTLEEQGFNTTIIEATNEVGGRVKTTIENDIAFDHGFQVMLTAYPQVQKHLDLEALELQYFKPGALIFKNGKTTRIGDPLRDLSALWPTLISTVGTLIDKWKIFKLTQELKKQSISKIFEAEDTSTITFLRNYGFSEAIISNFFKPFFTGIFLEEELRTSSRMFNFIFKMFAEGYAAVPKKGIGAIAQQLKNGLSTAVFKYNTKVVAVANETLTLSDGSSISQKPMLSTFPLNENVKWKSCHNFYFRTAAKTFDTGIIALIADENSLVNNMYYLFTTDYPVLSVTVVKETNLSLLELEKQVRKELQEYCGLEVGMLLKHYEITKALPELPTVTMHPKATSQPEGVFKAGDYTLNGSLNAAMASGEAAAYAAITYLRQTT
ncbi:oxidoreductase [Croceivirga lutea]|uniref:FAD-dependent oxidoreductase n=1 Tax=Croceivirga lutea TaxID=1775167 RepID=UPI00163A9839|nr:FAD-dependent oxidoreductase [Croceivirga lutea]GGG39793.1 oxidoreductase [Croceivirga lutea]